MPIAWYVFPQNSDIVGQKLLDQTASILTYFQSLIGPYPYEKLAQVESVIRVGGMENASAIFYNEGLFDKFPFPEDIVAHEIAHQWFGDSVTEYDWDHLWLSEGFATYLEVLFSAHMHGPESLKGEMATHAAKLAGYAPALTRPIIDPAETDPAKKLTLLNYAKGAWVLHMLRGMVGEDNFFRGIRRFYSMYEGKNISSGDFEKVMESVSGTDLNNFFRQWLYTAGWPEYRLSWHWNETAGELEITVQQVQGRNLFDMPVEIVVFADGHGDTHKFRIFEATHTFRVPCRTRPVTVEFDPNNWILKTATTTQR